MCKKFKCDNTNRWYMHNQELVQENDVVYSYADACKRHNKDERPVFLEKYTSDFIESVACERELETEQNCNILTTTLLAITAFLSRSPGLLNKRPGGPASLEHVPQSSIFSPTRLIPN